MYEVRIGVLACVNSFYQEVHANATVADEVSR